MKVALPTTKEVELEINEYQAFNLLLKTLEMDIFFKDDGRKFIADYDDYYGDSELRNLYEVYRDKFHIKRKEEVHTAGGDLYIALRLLGQSIIPNWEYRGVEIDIIKQ